MPPLPTHKNMLNLSGETDAIMHEWEPRAAVVGDILPVPTDLFGVHYLDVDLDGQTDHWKRPKGDYWHHQARGSDYLEAEEVSNGYTSRLNIYERTGDNTFISHLVNQNSGAVLEKGKGFFYAAQTVEDVYVVRKHGLLAEVRNEGQDEDGNTAWRTLITTPEAGSTETLETVSADGRLLRSSSLVIRGGYRYTEERGFFYDESGTLTFEHREFKATRKSPTQFEAFTEDLTYEYDDDRVVITGQLLDGTESRKIIRQYDETGALLSSEEAILVGVFPFEEANTMQRVSASYDQSARPTIFPSEMARH